MDMNTLQYVVGEAKAGQPAVIRFFGRVTEETTSRFNDEFDFLENIIRPSCIRVLINSEGGSVLYGMSTYSTIANATVDTECIIEGVAASMASIIWAAGKRSLMRDYAILMIHNPMLPDDDGGEPSDMVTAFTKQIETIYRKRFGLKAEHVRAIMDGQAGKDGTYFDAQAAVKAGIIPAEHVIHTSKQLCRKVHDEIEGLTDTAAIQELQTRWRDMAHAARRTDRELFTRFRSCCDSFFAAKAEYFKATRERLAANLAAKTALADEAEALKDSEEWTKAGNRFVEMQKEWRTIGPVAKRYSDALWTRFMDACNHFFERKKKVAGGRRDEENANLAAKRALVDRLNALDPETPRAELLAAIKEIQDSWQTIGHVPFREKDKVYDLYRARLDELRDAINSGRRRERREQFAGAVARMEGDTADRERDRMARALEAKRAELRTLENNLGFLSSKSKSGNSLIQDFERKIERLRADIDEMVEKIKMLRTQA